ncbi:hypothetical protein ACRAWF_34960 [Streptomyces sp. L7]
MLIRRTTPLRALVTASSTTAEFKAALRSGRDDHGPDVVLDDSPHRRLT